MSRASDLAQIDPRAARMIASVRSGIHALVLWPIIFATTMAVMSVVGLLVTMGMDGVSVSELSLSDPWVRRELLPRLAIGVIIAFGAALMLGLSVLLAVPRKLENMALEDLWKTRDGAQGPTSPGRDA